MNLLIIHAVLMNKTNHIILMNKIKHDINLTKQSVCFYCASLIVICFKCFLINKSASAQSASIKQKCQINSILFVTHLN